jgi:cell division control protein 6
MIENPNFSDFFKEFRQKSPIFSDYIHLTSELTLDELVDREEQISKIWTELVYTLEHNLSAKTFFLFGPPGTGKTETIKYILKKTIQWAKLPHAPKIAHFYNNCAIYNTPYSIMRELCRSLKIPIPQRGFSTEEAYTRFLEKLPSLQLNYLIIIFDEIDLLYSNKKAGNDLLYKISRSITSESNPLRILFFGITNNLLLVNALDSRVKSSLYPIIEILFPPYSAIELQKILYHRAKRALKPEILQYGAIEFIAAHFAQTGGDARQAITVLRLCGEMAEKSLQLNIQEAQARLAIKKYMELQNHEIIQSLDPCRKKILEAIQNLQSKKIPPLTGDLYNEYQRLCLQSNYPLVGPRQFSNHLKHLEKLNLVNIEPVHRGIRGNSRKITSYFP